MLVGYKKYVNADKAVINTRLSSLGSRSGSNAGMIDIFYPEKLSSKINKSIQNCTQITFKKAYFHANPEKRSGQMPQSIYQ